MMKRMAALFVCFTLVLSFSARAQEQITPAPLLTAGQPVSWWFVFKFNAKIFPNCDGARACPFGGEPRDYDAFGQQYVYASSEDRALRKGSGCLGSTTADPVGATFDEVYSGSYYYVVWNDQFYDDPRIVGCAKSCGAPWGHSKGMLVWNEAGNGLVFQVTTPSWPAAGSKNFPRRTDGNTPGCVIDNDVKVSQDFFGLKLTKDDVVSVLKALKNASVVTDPTNRQIVNNGGPADIQELVANLGTQSDSNAVVEEMLSSGVDLISKPSNLNVPPWQLVSAVLGGVSLRAATWWATPKIYSTRASTEIGCWDDSLGTPGAVKIATTGQWDGKIFGLTGGAGPNFNHAKIGVSISGSHRYVIFGDMNQQGALSENYIRMGQKCSSSQNGRGGLFYVLDDETLSAGITALITGGTAPTKAPAHRRSRAKLVGHGAPEFPF